MVLLSRDGAYEALTHDGWVRFRRTGPGPDGYELVASTGADPLADQSTDKFAPLADERAHAYPHRTENAYPFAFDTVAQLFDHPAAPDLCVIHSAAHNWEDQGGHRGEHGSPGVVQARAPFVIAGKGVRTDGLVPRAGRLVDVAPTIARAARLRARTTTGTYLAGQDGEVRADVLDLAPAGGRSTSSASSSTAPTRTCSTTWPRGRGTERRAPDRRWAPRTEHGAMAGLPTVTLANHTSILTGRLPGHHGILNNAWYDRRSGRADHHELVGHVAQAMETLTPGAESIHDAVRRTWADAFTASVNEPVRHRRRLLDLRLLPPGRGPADPDDPVRPPHTTERFVRPSKDYQWSSIVDHMCIEQAVGIWSGSLPRRRLPAAAVHVGQLHAHRLRDARGRSALGDRGGVDPRLRRPHRRGARRGRAGRRVRRHRVRARGRPRHGGERPDRARRLGRPAPEPGSRSATRRTASSTSAWRDRPAVAGAGIAVVLVGARRSRARGVRQRRQGDRTNDGKVTSTGKGKMREVTIEGERGATITFNGQGCRGLPGRRAAAREPRGAERDERHVHGKQYFQLAYGSARQSGARRVGVYGDRGSVTPASRSTRPTPPGTATIPSRCRPTARDGTCSRSPTAPGVGVGLDA